MIGVKLKIPNLLIVVIYRQPDTNTNGHRSTSAQYNQPTASLRRRSLASLESPSLDIIFCSDFKLTNIMWSECTTKPRIPSDECAMLEDTQRLCNEFFLSQQVSETTH